MQIQHLVSSPHDPVNSEPSQTASEWRKGKTNRVENYSTHVGERKTTCVNT